jgi:hypothetical protein
MEADELFDEALESINRYRVSLVVWMRAHQKMASGVVQPAEWFDLNDAPAFLIRAGTRVL